MSATAAVTTLAPKSARKVHPSRFREASGARNVWAIGVDELTTWDEVLAPEYWSHIAQNCRPGDYIEVKPDDGSYVALLHVVSVQRNAVGVCEIYKKPLHGVAMPVVTNATTVEFKGPNLKWCVIRTKDKVRVGEGHETQAHAQIAAQEYQKVLSR